MRLPNESIFSVKSGANGADASTLKDEITSHEKVKTLLEAGGTYVYCAVTPISQEQYEKLESTASAVAAASACEDSKEGGGVSARCL